MVAKAAWLTVEPEISLESFLASEETDFFPPALSWMPNEWVCIEAESDVRCGPSDCEPF